MTDLSEESVLGADRYALAVCSRLSACLKKLSSSRPEGQERLGGAEAAGLSGCFRSTRLRCCWWRNGRPRAPQTVVGGGCAGARLLPVDSFLGKECSLDKEEEGVVPNPSRHVLLKSSRLRFGGAAFLDHRANRLPK